MRAVLCKGYGGPDDLAVETLPDPAPGKGEALVRVESAALNFFDNLMIAGKYQFKPPFPFSPAAEFAGTVQSAGEGVDFAPGDRVIGHLGFNAARELVVAPASRLARMPPGLDFDRAAGLSVTYGTSYYALKDRAALKPGETLVVLGASGGVGIAAVELGKLMGARVIACASSDEKLDFARRHGADEGINYTRDDLRAELKRLGGDRGVDVVYDPVGGDYTEPCVRALGWQGRLLVIGFAAGEIPKLPLNLVLLKGCQIVGVFWGAWLARAPQEAQVNYAQLLAWCAEGKLSSAVHARYPLEQTAAALHAIARREAMGKIIIKPQAA